MPCFPGGFVLPFVVRPGALWNLPWEGRDARGPGPPLAVHLSGGPTRVLFHWNWCSALVENSGSCVSVHFWNLCSVSGARPSHASSTQPWLRLYLTGLWCGSAGLPGVSFLVIMTSLGPVNVHINFTINLSVIKINSPGKKSYLENRLGSPQPHRPFKANSESVITIK